MTKKEKFLDNHTKWHLGREVLEADLDELLKEAAGDAYLEGYSIVPDYDRSNFEDYWNQQIQ